MFRGFGTILNIATVLVGSGIGVLIGQYLPRRTRDVVTDALGLVTLLIAAQAAMAVQDPAFVGEIGSSFSSSWSPWPSGESGGVGTCAGCAPADGVPVV